MVTVVFCRKLWYHLLTVLSALSVLTTPLRWKALNRFISVVKEEHIRGHMTTEKRVYTENKITAFTANRQQNDKAAGHQHVSDGALDGSAQ